MIIGVDPGKNTGIAVFKDGKLDSLHTTDPLRMLSFLREVNPSRIIFEDSRLQSVVFARGLNQRAMLKVARNVGEIDAWCSLIVAVAGDLGIACHGISPKQKGHKLDARLFGKLTGWDKPSNQHTRDAAMVCWAYRGAA